MSLNCLAELSHVYHGGTRYRLDHVDSRSNALFNLYSITCLHSLPFVLYIFGCLHSSRESTRPPFNLASTSLT